MEASHRALLAILLLLLAWVYVRGALRPCPSQPAYQILQPPLQALTPQLLYERYPIVVQEPLVDPMQLLGTLFKYQYLWSRRRSCASSASAFQTVRGKFCLIFNPQASHTLSIVHPHHRAERRYTDILMSQHQCAILPYGWQYASNSTHTQAVALHDPITVLF
jgi:hypothetical protein